MADTQDKYMDALTDVAFDGLKAMKAALQYLGKDGPEFQRLHKKATIGIAAVVTKGREESAKNNRMMLELTFARKDQGEQPKQIRATK